MNNPPRPFQIILYFGFGALFFVAIFLFATFSGGGGGGAGTQPVTIWGTLDSGVVSRHINTLSEDSPNLNSVSYRQVDERTFDSELVNAIAEQSPPDLVLLPHTKLVQHRTKLFPLQYENTVTQRQFSDWYLDGFSLFTRPDGLFGLPLAVDPLVMYWNRDMYAANGLPQAPRTWEAIVNTVVPTMVRRNSDRSIQVSPVALGEYRNNRNAYATISALLYQSGSRMVEEDQGRYSVNLTVSTGAVPNPLQSVLQFYTQFGIPSSQLYTWNRTMPSDREAFLSSDLATYFGYASEIESLRRQNPNLNFDVASFPQNEGASIVRTHGTFYGFALLRTAPNPNGAYEAASQLTSLQSSRDLATALDMVPPYRQAISAGTSNPAAQVAYDAALVARGWLNPDFDSTDTIFRNAIDDVLAGRQAPGGAANDLVGRISQQF